MLSVEIQVSGRQEPAALVLATESDIEELKTWGEKFRDDTTQETKDIVEYTTDALKKRAYQAGYGRCPATWEDFLHKTSVPSEEVSGLFVLKSPLFGDLILGFVLVKRTWIGNLVLEYLAIRPKSDRCVKEHRIKAGGSLLVGTLELGNLLEVDSIWWETSLESVGFYQKMLSFTHQSDRYELSRAEYRAFLAT